MRQEKTRLSDFRQDQLHILQTLHNVKLWHKFSNDFKIPYSKTLEL